jgi:hypothetical protein
MGTWVGFFVYFIFWLSGIRLFVNFWVGLVIFGAIASGTSYVLCQIFSDDGVNIKFKN